MILNELVQSLSEEKFVELLRDIYNLFDVCSEIKKEDGRYYFVLKGRKFDLEAKYIEERRLDIVARMFFLSLQTEDVVLFNDILEEIDFGDDNTQKNDWLKVAAIAVKNLQAERYSKKEDNV